MGALGAHSRKPSPPGLRDDRREAGLKDGKSNQAEEKADAKVQDKRRGTWDHGKQRALSQKGAERRGQRNRARS